MIKTNAEAFKNLASEEDIIELTHVYAEYFSLDDDDNEDSPPISTEPILSFGMGEASDGGDLGMEVECKLGPDVLAERLGFRKHQLPLQFNRYRHRSVTAWEDPNLFNANPVPDSLARLKLHWHQLAGVHSMVRNIFTPNANPLHCTGMLVSDEVGLGKTALAISFIAFLSQCALLQQRNAELPPIIRKQFSASFWDTSPHTRAHSIYYFRGAPVSPWEGPHRESPSPHHCARNPQVSVDP
jgi:hypothetical protein